MAKASDKPGSASGSESEVIKVYKVDESALKDKIATDKEIDVDVSASECARLPLIEVEFNYKTKFDRGEYEEQLENQSKGMSRLTVAEFLENRERYKKEGRSKEGNKAQQAAREKALREKIDELLEEEIYDEKEAEYRYRTYAEAEAEAKEWIKTQAALHDPDQIAGGHADRITGMGDRRINSSIGSQWKNNIADVHKKIEEYAKDMTEEEKKNTYLNMKLFIR